MQQKYCDQGRSTTCPICPARSSCGSGEIPRNASMFPSMKSRLCVIDNEGSTTQRISLLGSSTTCAAIRLREREKTLRSPDPDPLPLQVAGRGVPPLGYQETPASSPIAVNSSAKAD